ncbi:hypothetical protein B0T17DRAFT_572134 [Bombardia bombarda]|uniref:N-acetyltransferase domain-containing protein n=1 Tax=Bombardia bombarda TaxID=252184 RepID=A0AA40C7V3_9PEZI|nr:hypothetical protein B0T17DRAFT_572134 [Bombardia bombarda]
MSSRGQQPSIRSFFQPRPQPGYAAPPSSSSPTSPSAGATPPPPSLDSLNNKQSSSPPVTTTKLPANLPVLPSPPSLPTQASIVPLTEDHIPALRRINALLLPVAYPDSFYANALEPLASGLFSRTILWKDDDDVKPKVVGGVVCRLEPNQFLEPDGQPRPRQQALKMLSQTKALATPYHAIYIQSLVLLSPYRAQGLAAAALEHIIASATILPAAGSSINVQTIYAHVWTENEEGLKWYEARGFARDAPEPIQGYYFKLRPDTAWLVRRDIGPSAAVVAPASPSPAAAAAAAATSRVPPPPPLGRNSPNSTVAAAVNLKGFTGSSSAAVTPPPPGLPRQLSTASTASSLSFQNSRPDMEWNDLPADMVGSSVTSSNISGGPVPGRSHLSPPTTAPGSGASSRSSSTARKKKERAYPAAAFGGG